MNPTFASLRIPNYRRYAAGMVVSNAGTWMQRVAQDWLVLELSDGDPVALGITTALQFLPLLLFAPLGGVIADRFDQRRILLITNAFLGLVALALGSLVLGGHATVWQVYVFAFAVGCGAAMDAPARQTFVTALVDRPNLPNAVALNSASFHAGRLIGPGVAGLLIEAFDGTGLVFLLNALTFVAPLLALATMRIQDLHPAERSAAGARGIREGVRYVRARPDLLAILFVVFFAGMFGLNFQIFNALMATLEFDKGAGEFGLLGTLLASGSLIGTLLVARRGAVRMRLVLGAGVWFGLLEVVAGLMPSFLWYALALPPVGIAALTMLTAANASLQLSVDPAMRGRVMALYMAVFAGGTPIGSPMIGWIAGAWGPRWPLLIGGVVTALAAVVAGLGLARSRDARVRDQLFERRGTATPYAASTVDREGAG